MKELLTSDIYQIRSSYMLDDRFLRPEYQKMYPREWENVISVRRENVRKQLDIFWKN